MGVVNYLTIEAEVLSETRYGVSSDYIPDPLGSTAKIVNSSGTVTDEFQYWPYGEVISHSGTNPTPFQFGGRLGYYNSDWSGLYYVRARILDPISTGWMSVDPFWPSEPAYRYAASSPITYADPSGLCPPQLQTLCKAQCRAQMSPGWKHWNWNCTATQTIWCTPLGLPIGPPQYTNYKCTCTGVVPRPLKPIPKPPCGLICQVLCQLYGLVPLPPPYDNIDFGPGNCEKGCEHALKAAHLCE